MNPLQLKEIIEKETGLKISMRIEPLSSSMKNRATYTPRKEKGEWMNFPYKWLMEFKKKYSGTYPNETFANKERISFYFGIEVYNFKQEKKPIKEKIPFLKEVRGLKVPKYAREGGYFIGVTYNYGRRKGVKGSGGWGIGPNTVNAWYELNIQNVQEYAKGLPLLHLSDGTKIEKSEYIQQNKKP